jgi:hypothetical protein
MRTIEFLYILLLSCLFDAEAQQINNRLFESKEILPLKLQYTNKQVKKDTDKKNAIYTDLFYKADDQWDTVPVSLRARGNFRRAACYFPPLKIYLKKGITKNTPFQGHKNLKIVLPCLLKKRSNDDVLKEYLAYKIYEALADVHFKTRLATISYVDTRGEKSEIHPLTAFLPQNKLNDLYEYKGEEAFAFRKPKKYQLLAILIEDDKKVAKRHNAKILERFVHPLNQEEVASTTNAFFQFMIGNTDFSTAYQHNQKLIFKDLATIPIPYDFDMSGLVNASYSVVSNVQNDPLDITKVTERKYRGFKRSTSNFQKVRNHFLQKQPEILELIEAHKKYFEDPKSFQEAKNYILSFFSIIQSDSEFNLKIVQEARTK